MHLYFISWSRDSLVTNKIPTLQMLQSEGIAELVDAKCLQREISEATGLSALEMDRAAHKILRRSKSWGSNGVGGRQESQKVAWERKSSEGSRGNEPFLLSPPVVRPDKERQLSHHARATSSPVTSSGKDMETKQQEVLVNHSHQNLVFRGDVGHAGNSPPLTRHKVVVSSRSSLDSSSTKDREFASKSSLLSPSSNTKEARRSSSTASASPRQLVSLPGRIFQRLKAATASFTSTPKHQKADDLPQMKIERDQRAAAPKEGEGEVFDPSPLHLVPMHSLLGRGRQQRQEATRRSSSSDDDDEIHTVYITSI